MSTQIQLRSPGRAAAAPWRPLRIAMVGQKGLPATIGGVERHVEEVGSRLAARGHEVLVYCRSTYGRFGEDRYRGMRLVAAPTIGTKHLDAIVHSASSTVSAMRSGADVVHYHALGPGLVSPLPRFLSRSAVVLTVHGLDHQRDKWAAPARAVLGTAHWMSGRVPDRTVVVSKDLHEHYSARFRRPVTHIANGVAVPPETPPSGVAAALGLVPGRFAMFVGRLVPEKRPDLLIEAVRRSTTDGQLAVVGESSFTDEYSRRLRDLAAGDPRIVFTGFVGGERLTELYRSAGVFVQPSDLEGLPLTLLEAVACGAPVLASDIPPHLEVLGSGSTRHRLFRHGEVEALRTQLEDMLGGAPVEGGEQLRARVLAEYSWEATVDRLEELYLGVAPSRERSLHARAVAR